jgi:hypothetical protein
MDMRQSDKACGEATTKTDRKSISLIDQQRSTHDIPGTYNETV